MMGYAVRRGRMKKKEGRKKFFEKGMSKRGTAGSE
jgi:hypothetical protein